MEREHIKLYYFLGVFLILFSIFFFILTHGPINILLCLFGIISFISGLYGDKRFPSKIFRITILALVIIAILTLIYLYFSLNNSWEQDSLVLFIWFLIIFGLSIGACIGLSLIIYLWKTMQFNKGVNIVHQHQYKEACQYFDKILKKDSENPLLWAGKALALQELGGSEEAFKSVNKALNSKFKKILGMDLSKNKVINALIFNTVGFVYYERGNYEKAIEFADKAIELDKRVNGYKHWNLKGLSLSGLGKDEEAIKCFDSGLKLRSKSAMLLNNKGDSLNNMRRYSEAMEYADKALKIDSKIPDIYITKAKILISTNNYENALKYINKALELYPDFERAVKVKEVLLELMEG